MEKKYLNILFLTLVPIDSIDEHSIYADTVRAFHNAGHTIVTVSPVERRTANKSYCKKGDRWRIVRFSTLNIQKSNIIEKTIGTFSVDTLAKRAIKQFTSDIKFDLAIFTTPPITITSTITWVKKQCGAQVYLLLKDIFPQNAVDLGMMKNGGLLHKYFEKKEKRLYTLVDRIGCMSPANVEFILTHNSQISANKVELCPNSIDPQVIEVSYEYIAQKRAEFGIPASARVFLYGGNLGKPQGIDFLIQCLEEASIQDDVFFLIVGSGTEFGKLQKWFKQAQPTYARLLGQLPKDDYDRLVSMADVGMIFLDKRFSIPNFPSRLLSYMENKKPIWSVVDSATDIGKISKENQFGNYSLAGNKDEFLEVLKTFCLLPITELQQMGLNGWNYMHKHYLASQTVQIITNKWQT